MPENSLIVGDAELEGFWDDFQQRMSPSQADKLLSVSKNTVMAAIRRKEIAPLRCPGTEHVYVTPKILAQWVRTYWQIES